MARNALRARMTMPAPARSRGRQVGWRPPGGPGGRRLVRLGGARPDQVEVARLALDQPRVDGGRERRVIERDRQIGAVLLGDLAPCRADLEVARQDAEVRGVLVVLVGRDQLDLDA